VSGKGGGDRGRDNGEGRLTRLCGWTGVVPQHDLSSLLPWGARVAVPDALAS